MLYEPTSLASLTGLLVTALRDHYGIDPAALFSHAGIPLVPEHLPQHRYPLSTIRKLWEVSKQATGDDTIGLKAGTYATPAHFYAFGYSWMASSTLLEAMQRLVRYHKLVSTASFVVALKGAGGSFALSAEFPDKSRSPPRESIDCGMTALLALCDIITEKEIRPSRIELTCPATVHPDAYRQALRAPIKFSAKVGTFYFSRELLMERLRHGAPDIAYATDTIAERYIESLDRHKVASQVRELLIKLLPSGGADQVSVSRRLNRSASTLQRQLQDEGLTYREVLDTTRRRLAEAYLTDGQLSVAQVAYMLGFSDQSNFSRAFRRWTSKTPKQYQAGRPRFESARLRQIKRG
jgi:AraC-like DNA-binding protein